MQQPITIVILGAGNIATHLLEAFAKTSLVEVLQVYNHHQDKLESFNLPTTTSLHELVTADVYLLAVKDDAVATLSSKLPTNVLVVHTSGSKAMTELKNVGRKGVFYPLQSFTKGISVNFKEIPICLEAEIKEDYNTLQIVAEAISDHVRPINSQQREVLHLSAVFVNNFSNYLYTVAEDLCKLNKVSFDVLHPLIIETARKATVNSPRNNQTGPAVRKDSMTLQKHIGQLENSSYKHIYQSLTKAIQDYHLDNL